MRTRTLLAPLVVLLVATGPAAAHATQDASRPVVLIVLPEDEARALVSTRNAALALGVDPHRPRLATAFVEAIGAQAGGVSRLRRSFEKAGIGVALGAPPDAPSGLLAAAARGFGGPVMPVEDALGAPVAILVLARGNQLPAIANERRLVLVLGIGSRTPALVAMLGRSGTLRAGDRPRPGIVAARDVRATMLRAAEVSSTGSALAPVGRPASLRAFDRLTRRFSLDDASRYALSVTLSAALFVPLALAMISRRARAWGTMARLAQATAVAPVGYVVGLFAAEAPKGLRILPVLAAAVAGAVLPPTRSTARVIGVGLLGVAGVIAVGAVVAPFRWAAEPALTLWGSPLELNRVWGLVNSLVALILGGLVAGWSLARLPDAVLIAGGLAAALVSGAAAVGANFVAPLWIIVAVWVGVAARRRGGVRIRDLLAALIAGAVAFAVALFASLAGPASHGSVAAERILDEGWRAVWELVRAREEVNVGEFTGRGAWFIIWTAAMTIGLVVALGAALRAREQPDVARRAFAGAVALTAGALAALVTEDTGVLVAPILAAMAGVIWLHHRATTRDGRHESAAFSGSERGGSPSR